MHFLLVSYMEGFKWLLFLLLAQAGRKLWHCKSFLSGIVFYSPFFADSLIDGEEILESLIEIQD